MNTKLLLIVFFVGVFLFLAAYGPIVEKAWCPLVTTVDENKSSSSSSSSTSVDSGTVDLRDRTSDAPKLLR